MPKKIHEMPADRADWNFGDTFFWHFFVFGSRPEGRPTDAVGRPWYPKEARDALRVTTVKTVWNYVDEKSLPFDSVAIEEALFGASDRYDAERIELRQKLKEARERADHPQTPDTGRALVSVTGRAVVRYESTFDEDDAEEAGPERFGEILAPAAENIGNGAENSRESGPLIILPPLRGRPVGNVSSAPPKPRRRKTFAVVLVGLAALLGYYGWARWQAYHAAAIQTGAEKKPGPGTGNTKIGRVDPSPSDLDRQPPTPAPPPPERAPAKLPDPPVVTAPPAKEPDRSVTTPPPAREPDRPMVTAPPVKEPEPPAAKEPEKPLTLPPIAPKALTEEEQRVIEQRRIEDLAAVAREQAIEAAKRKSEEESIRRNQETAAAAKEQRDREADARNVTAVGFSFREKESVSGVALGNVLTLTVADCALSCLSVSCDGFSYNTQGPRAANTPRMCYRYGKPLIFREHPYYTSGERLPDSAALAPGSGSVTNAAVATRTAPVEQQDRCAKVTGFRITCDRIIAGGTTLGSTQLAYTVANIDECAAKCRPISRCVGFAFNAADPPGRHSCTIFGPTPEGRASAGWIAGER